MVECPSCRITVTKIKKEWDYQIYHVKMYICDRCGKSVRAYYRENKLNHTIPKSRGY